MALVVKDRVQETTATTGTGTITLAGAVLGYQTFATVGDGNTTYYTIVDLTAGDWEVGIGTYTSSGTTLSRTTVLSSSNAGSLVPFGIGTKNVFVTYPSSRSVYLSAAGLAVDVLDIGTLGTSTANITTANITSGTVSTTPTNNTDIVNKQYADAIASGIHFHEAVGYATTAALPACTYNNGTSGVGATLTANANGALTVDSYTFTSPADNGTRILIKNQATQADNGVYTLSQAGNSSPGAPFILTRATDFDTVGTGVNQIDEGDFFLVTSGTVNLNTAWVQQTAPPIVVGTTAIVFQQFSAPITYTAGTGLNESPTYTFNIANTGVSAATYGSASSVPVVAVNAQGQITSATDTAIAIAAGAVSGLAASATTDTTDANNITSGSLGTSRLSGSYTGITGVGTLTAGTWNGSTIGAGYGGTGFSSYAVGDLLYADTTSSLAKLADVAVGNALISGGVGAAPSWGKIGMATHVDGTLPIANGGTNTTATPTNGGVTYGTGSAQAYSVAGTSGQVLQSNGAAAPTWLAQSSIAAGSATLATTATTANATAAALTAGTYLTSGGTFNGSTARTFAVDATTTNTASKVVARDASGNFSAGTITATLSGAASSATNATFASSATNASFATNATFASSATNASFASSATNASFATNSNNASAKWVSAAIAGSQGSNVSAVEVRNNGGTGDSNLANITFHCQGAYGASLHLRPDAYFGVGGWSATAWRWYTYLGNGDMTAAGNVTAYSDPRLKTEITPIQSALSIVQQLNGVKFKWIESSIIGHPGEYDYGVLADQVQKVLPELVSDSMYEAPEGDRYKTVAYDKFAPILIEAVKELTAKVATLEESLKALGAK
jgi:hypothetical protein